jgi:hypothetical protein
MRQRPFGLTSPVLVQQNSPVHSPNTGSIPWKMAVAIGPVNVRNGSFADIRRPHRTLSQHILAQIRILRELGELVAEVSCVDRHRLAAART